MKAHLAARDVRSPPESVLPGYLGRPRRAPTCRGPVIKVSQVLRIGAEGGSRRSWGDCLAVCPSLGSLGHRPWPPHPGRRGKGLGRSSEVVVGGLH